MRTTSGGPPWGELELDVSSQSWHCDSPAGERTMLEAFWSDQANDRPGLVVSFNGKGFDAPYLLTRGLRHALRLPPVASMFLNRHRWQNNPHWDLMHAFDGTRVTLAEACAILDVPSPKDGMDGSQVADAVAAGRIEDVARYCEADVRATLACYDRLSTLAPFTR